MYPLLLRCLTLVSYLGLLLAILYWALVFGPDALAPALALWLLASSGLLLVAHGVVKRRKRSYLWLCFILLLYFVIYTQALFSNGAATHEIAAMLCIVVGFFASMLVSRQAG